MTHQEARDLFSDAFDNELEGALHRDFQAHLQECADCRSEFGEYRRALQAMRAMPEVKMPVAVTIPQSPPTARGRFGFSLTSGRGLASVAGLAAAAAILLVSTQFHGASSPSPGSSLSLLTPTAGSGPKFQAPLAADAQAGVAGCSPAIIVKDSVPSGGNSTTTTTGGSHLHLYTAVSTVAAGDTVTVYAAATIAVASVAAPGSTPSAPTVVAPCVSLMPPGVGLSAIPSEEMANSGGSVSSGSAFAQDARGPATAITWRAVDDSSRTTIIIPSTARSGDIITVVAEVPAGSGGIATAPAMEAVLNLRVR